MKYISPGSQKSQYVALVTVCCIRKEAVKNKGSLQIFVLVYKSIDSQSAKN